MNVWVRRWEFILFGGRVQWLHLPAVAWWHVCGWARAMQDRRRRFPTFDYVCTECGDKRNATTGLPSMPGRSILCPACSAEETT